MKNLLFISIILFYSCQQNSQKAGENQYKTPEHHIDALTKVFDAHGGYEQWNKMSSLSYKKGEESTITDLKSRKIKIESPTQTIGFDGENVWVSPDSVDASRARFYHNLYFYFYAMPFVVGDPGAYYETLDQKELLGKKYNQLKISFGEGVGDAPDDNYIILSDPETNKMEWLMYTVTYRSGEPSERYSLIKYDDWKEFNGLVLPTSLKWFQYKNDSVGAMRSETVFKDIKVSEMAPEASLFNMPENAQIAPR